MNQAVIPPNPSPWSATRFEHEAGPPRLCEFLEARSPALSSQSKLIEGLRRRIGGIERHESELGPRTGSALRSTAHRPKPWTVGASEIDSILGPQGLNAEAIHEIKPGTAGAGAASASMGFALRLAARRLQQLKAAQPDHASPRILWCITRASLHETGELYAPGLAALGLDPASLLIVETTRAADVLWAMEEGLKSSGLALVIGQPGRVDLTPARRLSLAAKHAATPCLLLTPHNAPAAAATSTRWRISPAASALHPFDARAPGHARVTATLERCQHHSNGDPLSLVLEWPHGPAGETHRVSVAAALAHRTLDAPFTRHRTG
jgi:protein ImuA